MKKSNNWTDYKILDAGNGEKIESWNGIILRRPDPQAIWPVNKTNIWNKYDGFYHRSNKGGGNWEFNKKLPEYWTVKYNDLVLKVSPTNFKHTGLFPEQAANWDYMMEKIKQANRPIKVLNLFAYTGAATMACSSAGAEEVIHVDAAKGMVDWAKENMHLSNLNNNKIRFIVDDCLKFVLREKRRGNKYDAIIMDPPSFGRGPSGEIWKFEERICELIEACLDILSDNPLFFTVNAYTTGISKTVLENILKLTVLEKYPNGKIEGDEIGLPIENNNLILPCGIYARWDSNN
ncbi:MAG: class I SAM-dependent methyltransferase [Bacilli bacterium]|nr:class I SAM-dependent methyltransferase [Bacilli bacterium]